MKRIRGLAAVFLAVMPVASSAGGGALSAYTKHDYETCKLVSSEAASQTHRCRGLAGIVINYHNDDDNSVIDFGRQGLVGETSYGDGFVFAGKTIEWRGVREERGLAPYAAIVRFDIGRSVSGPFRPRLIIFRLEGRSRSCLAASIDGRKPSANERARRLADSFVATFDCAKDEMRLID
jgi:hypothetical protein